MVPSDCNAQYDMHYRVRRLPKHLHANVQVGHLVVVVGDALEPLDGSVQGQRPHHQIHDPDAKGGTGDADGEFVHCAGVVEIPTVCVSISADHMILKAHCKHSRRFLLSVSQVRQMCGSQNARQILSLRFDISHSLLSHGAEAFILHSQLMCCIVHCCSHIAAKKSTQVQAISFPRFIHTAQQEDPSIHQAELSMLTAGNSPRQWTATSL